MLPRFLKIEPEYREYVWGGLRLRPGVLTAEAWIIHESDHVASGPLSGLTLEEIVSRYKTDFLGRTVVEQRENHFPLLIKLLDCAQWLSLQVHPNDQQALELEGPGKNGKTEAWFILDAAPDAQIIAGLKPGTTAEMLSDMIRHGTILDLVQYIPVKAGDTIFMPAGTIHALGPGLLVYEVQQSSDITYRVFDWNRPQTPTRVLHIDKSLTVANPAARSQAQSLPELADGESQILCQSEFFTLELLNTKSKPFTLDTQRTSFHSLTVIDGKAHLTSGSETVTISKYESVVVPAATGEYSLEADGSCRVLKSSL
jgi:mannose-6-phosphate isomerase